MSTAPYRNSAYGLSEALINVFPAPIISQRAPTTSDKAQLGTVWVDKPNNDAYVITSIVNNSANWTPIGGGAGDFTNIVATGTILAGGSIGSTTGNVTAALGNISALTGNVTAAGLISAGTSIGATTTITAGGQITSTAGNLVCSAPGLGVILGGGAKVVCGTGDPSVGLVSAPQGSLYLNLAGSGTGDRAYINTNGTTGWTAITTAT